MTIVIIETYPDSATLVAAAGDRLTNAIVSAVDARGRATVVLTGGGTGIGMLSHIGEHGEHIDWSKVLVFWGDDRFVPCDDDERNEKQARAALLGRIDIPAENVYAMAASDGRFGGDIDAAAAGYEQELAAVAQTGEPAPDFDVHLLAWAQRATSTRCSPTPTRYGRKPGWSWASKTRRSRRRDESH